MKTIARIGDWEIIRHHPESVIDLMHWCTPIQHSFALFSTARCGGCNAPPTPQTLMTFRLLIMGTPYEDEWVVFSRRSHRSMTTRRNLRCP